MPCASTIPTAPDAAPRGWNCDGTDLVQVGSITHRGKPTPIVVPASRVAEVNPAWPARLPYHNTGNHLHLCLPDPTA